MSYRLINANNISFNSDGFITAENIEKMPCIYADLPNGMDGKHYIFEQDPKTGHWITDAKTYYEELNRRGLGVDEYTPYFTDDIACSECLAKYSMLDNETQFFKHCPNCGAKMQEVEE